MSALTDKAPLKMHAEAGQIDCHQVLRLALIQSKPWVAQKAFSMH